MAWDFAVDAAMEIHELLSGKSRPFIKNVVKWGAEHPLLILVSMFCSISGITGISIYNYINDIYESSSPRRNSEQGSPSDIIAECDRLASDPDDVILRNRILSNRGVVPAAKIDDPQLATSRCQDAVNAAPKNARLHHQLARSMEELARSVKSSDNTASPKSLLQKARDEYKIAADDGYAPAAARYGEIVITISKDYTTGTYYLMKALDGSAEAEYQIGMYYNDGTNPKIKYNHEKAVQLIKKASLDGSSGATSYPIDELRP